MGTQLDEWTWEIGSRRVALPVRVREAALAVAVFPAPAGAVRARLTGTGLEPVVVGPRSLVSLLLVDYRDGDLGSYHEVGVALTVRHRNHIGLFVTQLPVTEEFTLDAGRSIWALPKWLAHCELAITGRHVDCHLAEHGRGGEHVLSAHLASAPLPLPLPLRAGRLVAFSVRDGQLLRTHTRVRARSVRLAPGGARLRLGRHHPMARELRELGLPRRALATVVAGQVSMSIGPALPA